MKADIGSDEGVKKLDQYVKMMEDTPEYAQLLLSSGHTQRSADNVTIGPLGYSLASPGQENPVSKTPPRGTKQKVPPAKFAIWEKTKIAYLRTCQCTTPFMILRLNFTSFCSVFKFY